MSELKSTFKTAAVFSINDSGTSLTEKSDKNDIKMFTRQILFQI